VGVEVQLGEGLMQQASLPSSADAHIFRYICVLNPYNVYYLALLTHTYSGTQHTTYVYYVYYVFVYYVYYVYYVFVYYVYYVYYVFVYYVYVYYVYYVY
jgi:hypothetical protein